MKIALLSPVLALALMVLTACALIQPPAPRIFLRDVVVDEAVAQLDRPYRYQGASPIGFDDSGLVQHVFGRSGIELPHSADGQHAQGSIIPFSQARRGDLLFYRLEEEPYQNLHVGIYIGRSRMVHIRDNSRVQIELINVPYWQRRLLDTVSYLP